MTKRPIAEILAKLAHDMNTPLTTIDGFLRCVDVTDPEMSEYRVAAVRSLEKLARVSDSMRSVAAREEATIAPHDVARLLKNIAGDALTNYGNSIRLLHTGPSRLVANIDKFLLERSILNFIRNAVEAGATSIELRLSHRGRTLYFEIVDNGSGIGHDILPNIFDINFTHGKIGGSGLGLSFCHDAIEAHGGTISLTTIEGAGTIFIVAIPNSVVLIGQESDVGPTYYVAGDEEKALREVLSRLLPRPDDDIALTFDHNFLMSDSEISIL